MLTYHGKSVYSGIAIGKLKFWRKDNSGIKCYRTNDSDAEFLRFKTALKEAKKQLDTLQKKLSKKLAKKMLQYLKFTS